MAHDHSQHGQPGEQSSGSYWTSRAFFVFLGFAGIAVVMLWSEHRAHLLGALPYLFILACPLMHLLGGHGSHGGHGPPREPSKGDQL